MLRVSLLTLITIVLLSAIGHAQPPGSKRATNTDQMPTGGQVMQGQQMVAQPEFVEMAKSMKSMADTCQMMMEKEMAGRPWKVAAVAVVGILGTAALALFVVLEVQWIRYWGIRIRKENQTVP